MHREIGLVKESSANEPVACSITYYDRKWDHNL